MIKQGELMRLCCPNCGRHLAGFIDEKGYVKIVCDKTFGINAELLIDHAWGWEPCTMKDIKSYKPERNSISEGQVLSEPYSYEKGMLIVKEMAEALSFDLLGKQLVTNQIVLTIGYDAANEGFKGESSVDWYGRKIPKHAHGTENLNRFTASVKLITQAALNIYERTVDKNLSIRRVCIVAGRVISENEAQNIVAKNEQLDLFTDYDAVEKQRQDEDKFLEKEKRIQQTELEIKKKYGKNAILRGMNLQEGATMKNRNDQIGGHRK